MSNTTEIKKQYTLGELPEVVKHLIRESRFVKSDDCIIRFTAIPTEDWSEQKRRSVNTALSLAVGQLPQACGYTYHLLDETKLDQSDVLIKAAVMASGDEHTVHITITTNRRKDLIADMTLSWLTCFVNLHEHSFREDDTQPDQEREKEMTVSTAEESLIRIAKLMETFDYDHALTPVVIVGNDESLPTANLALKVVQKHTTFNTVKLLNVDKCERVTDKYAVVVSCEENGNVSVYYTDSAWATFERPLLSVNLNFINPQTTEKKEEYQPQKKTTMNTDQESSQNGNTDTLHAYIDPISNTGFKLTPTQTLEKDKETMTENTQYVKNDNALAEILSKINSTMPSNPITTVLLKPLEGEGNQITHTHRANTVVGQFMGGTTLGRKAECYNAEIYTPGVNDTSDRFYVIIGFNSNDFENTKRQEVPKGGVPVVVKFYSPFNPKNYTPVIFEGFIDPISGVGYNKPSRAHEAQPSTDVTQLTAKLREVANYAKQVGIMIFANVSIPKLQFFLSENNANVGMMHKVESTWDTQVNLVNELITLANNLGANATVNISAIIQGNPHTQSFGVMNSPAGYVQPNVYPSGVIQQPPLTPNFFNGFHPQNHMPHNPYQPGYMGGVGGAFQPQGGPTVQGFKSQTNG